MVDMDASSSISAFGAPSGQVAEAGLLKNPAAFLPGSAMGPIRGWRRLAVLRPECNNTPNA